MTKTFQANETLSVHVNLDTSLDGVAIQRDGGGCVVLSALEIPALLGALVSALGGRLPTQEEKAAHFEQLLDNQG